MECPHKDHSPKHDKEIFQKKEGRRPIRATIIKIKLEAMSGHLEIQTYFLVLIITVARMTLERPYIRVFLNQLPAQLNTSHFLKLKCLLDYSHHLGKSSNVV